MLLFAVSEAAGDWTRTIQCHWLIQDPNLICMKYNISDVYIQIYIGSAVQTRDLWCARFRQQKRKNGNVIGDQSIPIIKTNTTVTVDMNWYENVLYHKSHYVEYE